MLINKNILLKRIQICRELILNADPRAFSRGAIADPVSTSKARIEQSGDPVIMDEHKSIFQFSEIF